mmetsp:Transcript_28715/g.86944  ORF Transcript_28715/g.86944 Transcript_28715/m.86944 type:complete len:302 (-) Transcript_28715:1000-1905(-)
MLGPRREPCTARRREAHAEHQQQCNVGRAHREHPAKGRVASGVAEAGAARGCHGHVQGVAERRRPRMCEEDAEEHHQPERGIGTGHELHEAPTAGGAGSGADASRQPEQHAACQQRVVVGGARLIRERRHPRPQVAHGLDGGGEHEDGDDEQKLPTTPQVGARRQGRGQHAQPERVEGKEGRHLRDHAATTAAAMAAGRHRVGRITSHAPLLPLLPEEEEVVGHDEETNARECARQAGSGDALVDATVLEVDAHPRQHRQWTLTQDELLDDLLAEEGEGEAAQGREVVGEHLVNEGEPLVE